MKNQSQNILFYSEELSTFEYGENHPFKPERARQFFELINRYSLIFESNQKIIKPKPLDEELLYLFHTKKYINLLKKCDSGEYDISMLEAGIGNFDNPVVKGMFKHSLLSAGATYEGAMAVINEDIRFAFNPNGGFHHAGPGNAEGFCFINDIAIAIKALEAKGKKIAYIDLDVHHGNGIQDAFYDCKNVLTISLHESGKSLYPWSGFENELGKNEGLGYNINIPFLKGTDDEVYLYAFLEIVPNIVTKFNPDIVFVEVGGDAHKNDPLANLNVTNFAFKKIFKIINNFSKKIIATGGGGYNLFKTASIWTLAWAAFCDITPEDLYAGSIGGMVYGSDPDLINLEETPYISNGIKKEKSMENAKDVVAYLKKNVFVD